MIYFDILPTLQLLPMEEVGELFIAMIEYGKDGKRPDFSHCDRLNVAWSVLQQMVLRDKKRYSEKIMRNTYGAYKREANRREEVPLPFEEWYQEIYLPTLEPGTDPPLSLPSGTDGQPEPGGQPEGGGRRRGGERFTPPTVQEVRAYCEERKNGVDPSAFVDFYASKGWMVGNQRMKDWRAAVRTWERRSGSQGGQNYQQGGRGNRQQGNQGAAPYRYDPGDTSGSL